jgi:hypothetical protein
MSPTMMTYSWKREKLDSLSCIWNALAKSSFKFMYISTKNCIELHSTRFHISSLRLTTTPPQLRKSYLSISSDRLNPSSAGNSIPPFSHPNTNIPTYAQQKILIFSPRNILTNVRRFIYSFSNFNLSIPCLYWIGIFYNIILQRWR